MLGGLYIGLLMESFGPKGLSTWALARYLCPISLNKFSLNIVNDIGNAAFMLTFKLNNSILWHAKLGHVHFKRMQDMSKDGLIPAFDMDTEKWNKKYFMTFIDDASRFCYVYLLHIKDEALDKFKVFKTEVELQQGSLIKRIRTDRGGEYMDTLYFQSVGIIHETTAHYTPQQNVVRLLDPKLKSLGERGIECIFVGYVEYSNTFRFYVIKPNESVSINSIIESTNAIFAENRFSSVPRPSQRSLINETEDIGDSVVPEEVTGEVVTQQPKADLRKGKRNRTIKNFGLEFQLYLIKETRDDVSDQHCYCFNVEDDLKTFDEAMKSQDYFDTYASVAHISTIRLLIDMASIYNWIIHQMDVKTTFLNGKLDEGVYMNQPQGFIMPGNENKVDLTKKFLSSKFSMKDIREADVILVSTPMDTSEKLIPNNGQVVSQLKYSRLIGCLMYVMTCLRSDIAFAVGKLSWYTSNPSTQHRQAIQRVLKYLKKTIDYSLTYTGYPSVLEGYTDASWISNIEDNSSTSGRSKPIAPISILCDSEATLAKAYNQIYNGKARHLCVSHNMIRELITNVVVPIEFVRSQRHLADHLTKGLARDLALKSDEGMSLNGLKHMYLHIIPKMCLKPAKKDDEIFTSQRLNSVSIEVSSASVIVGTDHNLWDIIVNGDLEDEATPSREQSSPPVPKTAKQLAARRN
ncbi:zinc finger, CCHC-type containing protein [Tanacetum coccineum]